MQTDIGLVKNILLFICKFSIHRQKAVDTLHSIPFLKKYAYYQMCLRKRMVTGSNFPQQTMKLME